MPAPTASTAPLAASLDGTGAKTASPRAWSWAALMHRAFGIDVLACADCGGRLRLIATLHDPAVIRKILAHLALGHSGRVPASPLPSPAPPRPDRIGSGARRTPSCWRREVAFVLIRPVHRSIDGGGLSSLACRSPEPARSIREKVADVHCGIAPAAFRVRVEWGARRRRALMLPIL